MRRWALGAEVPADRLVHILHGETNSIAGNTHHFDFDWLTTAEKVRCGIRPGTLLDV
jgi:hypothetical protein